MSKVLRQICGGKLVLGGRIRWNFSSSFSTGRVSQVPPSSWKFQCQYNIIESQDPIHISIHQFMVILPPFPRYILGSRSFPFLRSPDLQRACDLQGILCRLQCSLKGCTCRPRQGRCRFRGWFHHPSCAFQHPHFCKLQMEVLWREKEAFSRDRENPSWKLRSENNSKMPENCRSAHVGQNRGRITLNAMLQCTEEAVPHFFGN